ncbi:hydrogenase nickel incorporation protein HypB [Parafrankia irregularis]|uniref:Hydrogenase nickel incorporation protein HypB n=1 Tax=Parafrankia irregularis TaxID=795642 RepID=A0A0S4QR31_9ACTN|nr:MULTISPECIES: hydrogenase nickel incorporation protein HypB [Parafrankia]CUU57981.1 hydrogenase nickel incorporation protein HypB [Parafrankia irregularis]
MCGTCGCDRTDESAHETGPGAGAATRMLRLELDVLARNDETARENRAWLAARRTAAVNLMSSPGSGKTTLLEHTIPGLTGAVECAVIEGDQETRLDAERIRATGAPAVQVNTGTGCHLDAASVGRALRELDPLPGPGRLDPRRGALDPHRGSVVLIENVGNLVCPGLFDLGETARVVLTSVTEGEDKPTKYPHMYRAADLILLTKVDLLPWLAFDGDQFTDAVRQVNPSVRVLAVSANDGAGLSDWFSWLRALATAA